MVSTLRAVEENCGEDTGPVGGPVEQASSRARRAQGLCEALYWCGLLVSAAAAIGLLSVFLLAADPAGWLRFFVGHGLAWLGASWLLYVLSAEGRTWPRPE